MTTFRLNWQAGWERSTQWEKKFPQNFTQRFRALLRQTQGETVPAALLSHRGQPRCHHLVLPQHGQDRAQERQVLWADGFQTAPGVSGAAGWRSHFFKCHTLEKQPSSVTSPLGCLYNTANAILQSSLSPLQVTRTRQFLFSKMNLFTERCDFKPTPRAMQSHKPASSNWHYSHYDQHSLHHIKD